MKIIFAGTPEFAVPSLVAAARKNEVIGVYTQPDRPAGRGREVTFSPVKRQALELGLPVFQPNSLKNPESIDALKTMAPDLMIVVAYGLILPQVVLDIPSQGCWNGHASLLPRWRGAAPIQRAIAAGDTQTGVCLMKMEAGLDTGPVLMHQTLPILENETGGELHDRLAELTAQIIADGLGLLRAGIRPQAQPQSSEGVMYAHKLGKAEAKIDWSTSAVEIARLVRAFNPWPITETTVANERLRVYAAKVADISTLAAPGTLLAANADGVFIVCGVGVLQITQVQREGGKVIAAADYVNARQELQALVGQLVCPVSVSLI